jgi:predicted NAD-dependent protein-ADP-ribosyltransferase YbiA (DUF1768 family)
VANRFAVYAPPRETTPPPENRFAQYAPKRNIAAYAGARFGRGAASGLGFLADVPVHAVNTVAGRNRLGEALMQNPGNPGGALFAAATGKTVDMGPNVAEPVMQEAMTAFADAVTRDRIDPVLAEPPSTPAERYVGRGMEFVGSSVAPGGVMARVANVPRAALPALAAQDVALGGAQGLTYEGVKDITGGNEGAAALASLAVPFSPAAVAGATRVALGGGRARMAPALADAAAIPQPAGMPRYRPTASEAGGSDVAAVAERAGSFTLGSRGTVAARTQETNAALQAEAERIAREADRLAGFTTGRTESGAQAGAALWDGLRADADSWFNRSQASAQRAEARAAAAISAAAGNRPVMVNVTPLLARLRAAAARQREWGQVDPFVEELRRRLVTTARANGGLIPLRPAIRLKTHIGQLTRWSGAAPGADVALYRGLYGQLGEEIGNGIARLGRPSATNLWRASQRQWAEHFERTRHYLDPVEAKLATPEHIINQVMAIGTPSRAAELRRMVGERRWNQVRAYAIRRMGSSKPSGVEGTLAPGADDVFDPVTFATNWNAMQKSGHLETIFGGPGNRAWAQLRPEWDRLGRVAGRIQRTRRSMFNSSGSASSGLPAAQVTGLGGAVAATPFVGPTPIMMALGGIGGVGVSSRLMMSPRFVRWLSQDGQLPTTEVAMALTRLQAIIQAEPDPAMRIEMIELHDRLEDQFLAR